jgi:hypothetical protein
MALEVDPEFQFTGNDPEYETLKLNTLDWMNYITPRQLGVILNDTKMEAEDLGDIKEIYKLFSYTSKFIDCAANNLHLDSFDRHNIVYSAQIRRNAQHYFDSDAPQGNMQLRFETRSEKSPPLAVDIVKKIYKSISKGKKAKIEKIYEVIEDKGAFPSFMRFNMSRKEMLKLYGEAMKKAL